MEEIRSNPHWREEWSKRPSWYDAQLALEEVQKGNADAFKPAIWCRAQLQIALFRLGCFVQKRAIPVLLVSGFLLILCCFGLFRFKLVTEIEELWVEDGGRLKTELSYMRKIEAQVIEKRLNVSENDSSTDLGGGQAQSFQLVIQTPINGHGSNILNPADLLAHVEMMLAIAKMEIQMFDANWTLHDLCFAPPSPRINGQAGEALDKLLNQIIPCIIITPLDCFWEGSKPLGPFPPISVPNTLMLFLQDGTLQNPASWKNINPQKLMDSLKEFEALVGDLSMARDLFDRMGVIYAYQKKPCLNPFDPDCPKTAPNYRNGSYAIDYGIAMTGGCNGIAETVMQWPEDLIVGGLEKQNSTIIHAEALQSLFFLTSAPDIFARHKLGKKKGLNLTTWDAEQANEVLLAWQRNFSSLVYMNAFNENANVRKDFVKLVDRIEASETVAVSNVSLGDTDDPLLLRSFESIPSETKFLKRYYTLPPMFHPLAGTSVRDLLNEFSDFDWAELSIDYAIFVVYAAVMLFSCSGCVVRSCAGLAIAGCFTVTLCSAAGLGFTTLIGLEFNAATTNIVPFLTLGLGSDDMFLLLHSYVELTQMVQQHEIGHLLKECGLSSLITGINNILAFLCGGIIPVPALRVFCWQIAIVLLFNSLGLFTFYAALIALDLKRQRARRVDILCCIKVSRDKVLPSNGELSSPGANSFSPVKQDQMPKISHHKKNWKENCGCEQLLHVFVHYIYSPFLSRKPVKIAVLLFFSVFLCVGIYGTFILTMGLELTDLVPKGTAPYDFLLARERYFSFYPMNIIIKGTGSLDPACDQQLANGSFDLACGQQLIYELSAKIGSNKYVIKDKGALTSSNWLRMMRDYTIELQKSYEEAWTIGYISELGPKCDVDNPEKFIANNSAIMAYKLLINHGNELKPELATRDAKLVDSNGTINPAIFQNVVTLWYHDDSINYYISQANFYPVPHPKWDYWNGKCSNFTDDMKRIPPAPKILYCQIPYYLNGLVDTPAIVDMIKEIRQISEEYETGRGLPNFPEGIPFTFWEQYIFLRQNLTIATVAILAVVFVAISLLLMNVWTATICVVILAMVVVEMSGCMGLLNLKLNPISGVSLITSVGIGVVFVCHLSLSYLTTLGHPNDRMRYTIDHMFGPALHGGISTLLGIIILAFSEFEFIRQYFFIVMCVLIVLGNLNGLVLLPVLLSLIGPVPEIRPKGSGNFMAPPTPRALQSPAYRPEFDIQEIRQISKEYETDRDLTKFSEGAPFTFLETVQIPRQNLTIIQRLRSLFSCLSQSDFF